jgi:integrase
MNELVPNTEKQTIELMAPLNEGLSKNTELNYISHVKQFNEWNENDPITIERIREFILQLSKEGYSGKSIQSKKDALKRACKVTFKNQNPLFLEAIDRAFKSIRVNTTISRLDHSKIISKNDLKKVLESIDSPKLKLIFKCLFNSGVRISELCSIRIKDISILPGSLTIRLKRKGGKEELIQNPWNIKTHNEIMKTFHDSTFDKKDFLFKATKQRQNENHRTKSGNYSKLNGQYSRQYITRELREKTFRILGIAISPHKLRHSHATALINQKTPIDAIARRLGNRPETTAKYYLHAKIENKTLNEVMI